MRLFSSRRAPTVVDRTIPSVTVSRVTVPSEGLAVRRLLAVSAAGRGRAAWAAMAFWALAGASLAAQTAHFSGVSVPLGGGFHGPFGVAVDRSGDVYVADYDNNAVKEMPAGCASSSCVTVMGGGFFAPFGVAVDGVGNVYVGDSGNNAVKEMPAGCASSSCVSTLGGGFNQPLGVAVDGNGNVYAADRNNNAVKEMPAGCASSGCVSTLGGGFTSPVGVAVGGVGIVYVADMANPIVGVFEMPADCASSSCVSTLGGNFHASVGGVSVDGNGNIYVVEHSPGAVYEFITHGVNFSTVPVGTAGAAMTLPFTFDTAGSLSTTPYQVLTQGAKNLDFNAAATQESNACNGTTAYSAGDTCTVDVTFTPTEAGTRYGAVELLNAGGSTIATAYIYGTGTGPEVVFNPAKQSALGGGLTYPLGVAVDASGNVFSSNISTNEVYERPVGCASSSCLKTLGGGFNYPEGVAVDGSGNVYVADFMNDAVYEIPAGCASSSCVTTLGGGFHFPVGVTVDSGGNLYVADAAYTVLKKIPAGCASSSCVTSLGGGFNNPEGVAVDGSGNVYVADHDNNAVKEMPAGCASSSCVTVMGGGFSNPFGVAVDGVGNVYVGDSGNNAVKEMPAGCASSSCVSTLGSGFDQPGSVAVDGSGNVYVSDSNNFVVKEIDRAIAPSLSFAATALGATSSDSPQSVQIQNIGNQPLTAVQPGLVIGANFDQVPGDGTPEDCTSGFSLTPGQLCNLSISFEPQSAGTLTSTAVFTDNALNGNPATQTITLKGTVTQASQTITFTALGTPTAGTTATLSAHSSSNGTITFGSTTPSVCTVSGSRASFLTAGTCTLTASVPANNIYAAATTSQSVTVIKQTQTITFSALPSSDLQGTILTLTATATSGLPVSFTSLMPTLCSVSGSTATLLQAGTCTIQASQSGNATYAPAASVSKNVTVIAAFTITPTPSRETIYRGHIAAFLLELKAASGFTGKVTLSCSGGPSGSYCADFPMTVSFNKGIALAISGVFFPATTTPGTYTLTFTGTSGAIVDTASATFIVEAKP